MPKASRNLSKQITEVIKPYKDNKEVLIIVLQKIQEKFRYIPQETVSHISKYLGITQSEIFGVATFYAQFRFTAPPEHNIKVCLGTACHVQGGVKILEAVERQLEIKPGEITPDHKFGLERVACFGCCALAPVIVVDNKAYGKLTVDQVKKLLTNV